MVFPLSPPFLDLSFHIKMSLGWPLLNVANDPEDPLFLPPYALLIKHHPSLFNVKPSTETLFWTTEEECQQPAKLIATQPITAGQEFFLAFENHPHRHLEHLYRRIPTESDYKEADSIIVDERIILKVKNERSVSKKRIGEIGMGLRSTIKAVERYAPKVASLLPNMASTLATYAVTGASTSWISLRHQTHKSLASSGACISDVYEGRTSVVAKGETVIPVPLYFRRKKATTTTGCEDSKDSTCTIAQDDHACLGHKDSFLEICPLDGIAEIATAPEQINIVYQWRSTSGFVDGTNKRPETIAEVRLTYINQYRGTRPSLFSKICFFVF